MKNQNISFRKGQNEMVQLFLISPSPQCKQFGETDVLVSGFCWKVLWMKIFPLSETQGNLDLFTCTTPIGLKQSCVRSLGKTKTAEKNSELMIATDFLYCTNVRVWSRGRFGSGLDTISKRMS